MIVAIPVGDLHGQLEEGVYPKLISEFSRPFLGPPFNHNLGLGIELDCMVALPVKRTKEGFFPTTEREKSHRSRYSNVDTDIPSLGIVAELAGSRPAAKCRQTVSVRLPCESFRVTSKPCG